MAYRHYHTAGLVIGQMTKGEASRLYQILTPDFGLTLVMAQSIRLEKSKLRYNLQNYNFVDLDLVRGREYWRLIGAEKKFGRASQEQINFFCKISSIILRLIHGEEEKQAIFSDLQRAWELLASKPPLASLEDLEIFFLIRLLFNLGYLAPTEITAPIISLNNFSWSDLDLITKERSTLIRVINSSLLASGL